MCIVDRPVRKGQRVHRARVRRGTAAARAAREKGNNDSNIIRWYYIILLYFMANGKVAFRAVNARVSVTRFSTVKAKNWTHYYTYIRADILRGVYNI